MPLARPRAAEPRAEPGLGPAPREPARGARIERRHVREILHRGRDVVGSEVSLPAQQIEFGIVGIESDGARALFYGLRKADDVELGLGAIAIGGSKTRIGGDRSGEIANSSM